ncbi:MAG: hypothetical protein QM627_01060 [Luteolibacter sp.]
MSSRTLLAVILGGTVGLGGVLQGVRWKVSAPGRDSEEMKSRLQRIIAERDILKRENESLRSVVQGGGEVAVPQEWIGRVEKEFGLSFRSSPVVHQLSPDKLRDRIGAAVESRFGEFGVDYRQEAYSLIGWIDPGQSLLSQLMIAQSVGASGWFDDALGEAWVTDRFNMDNVPDQAMMVRLLVRILLHQNFPPPHDYPGDDRARAREALHQGAAAGAESRFYAEKARTIGFVPMKEDAEAAQIFASLPAFIQGLSTFCSVEGKGLADTAYIQGPEKIRELFKKPPLTTAGIFRPDFTGASELEFTSGDEVFLSESAGELGVKLWLLPLDEGRAGEIAASWRGDRYLMIPAGEAASAVIWEIRLESKEAADRFQQAALERIGLLAGHSGAVEVDREISALNHRQLKISRPADDRVRFTNSFSETP